MLTSIGSISRINESIIPDFCCCKIIIPLPLLSCYKILSRNSVKIWSIETLQLMKYLIRFYFNDIETDNLKAKLSLVLSNL